MVLPLSYRAASFDAAPARDRQHFEDPAPTLIIWLMESKTIKNNKFEIFEYLREFELTFDKALAPQGPKWVL
jgi:hypothetical protein